MATTMPATAWIQIGLEGTARATMPAANAPTARNNEKNVVLASSRTSKANPATNQMT